MQEIQRKIIAKELIEILAKSILFRKLETKEEVLAYQQIIVFLFSIINANEEPEKEKKEQELKLIILKEMMSKNIFHSYQAIKEILEEPESFLSKMIPFIFCFQEFLEQKDLINCCDKEKIDCLKEALLWDEEKFPRRAKKNIFCQKSQNEI